MRSFLNSAFCAHTVSEAAVYMVLLHEKVTECELMFLFSTLSAVQLVVVGAGEGGWVF